MNQGNPPAQHFNSATTRCGHAQRCRFTVLSLGLLTLLLTVDSMTMQALAAVRSAVGNEAIGLVWLNDYGAAVDAARESKQMLLVYFFDEEFDDARQQFEQQTLTDAEIRERLTSYTLLKIPASTMVKIDGQQVALLEQPAFLPMHGQQGLSVVDYQDTESVHYGRVVSCFPFVAPEYYGSPFGSIDSVKTLLGLPTGSLTQRTMIYAVRMHPEVPASTAGKLHPLLVEETQKHSQHQASIRLQGHHNWEFRFHDIRNRLNASSASEVCAESWPGKTLVNACLDCVHSWRQSSGHWNAVRSHHAMYAYDIKRGTNGIWYATGIFAE